MIYTQDRTMKVTKLTQKIHGFAKRLERTQEFTVHRNISQFYYMQKIAELDTLREQLDETHERLSQIMTRIESEYICIFNRWSHDVRWLQHYEMASKNLS